MKHTILVTVVHNRKQYLRKALNSAINSTLDKAYWNHLIIDSGSTQSECREIIKEYCDKYDHMYYKFFDENINQMPAYNWALEHIQKIWPEIEFMAMMDSDDLLGKFALESGYETMKNPLVDLTYSDFRVIDEGGNTVVKKHPKSKRLVPENIELTEEGQRAYRKYQLHPKIGNFATHFRYIRISSFLKKMDKFDETRPFSTDFSIYSFGLDAGMILKKIDKVLYCWRTHKKGKAGNTGQVEKDHGKRQHNDLLEMTEYFREKWTQEGRI